MTSSSYPPSRGEPTVAEARPVACKPAVLFVDDDTSALEGFRLTQRTRYRVYTADSGQDALDCLASNPSIAVAVSDLHMPHQDGAELLARVHRDYPDVVRVLLTGHSDMERAARAVNDGRVFRFLTKPCGPEELSKTLEAAVEMHGLTVAERVLLQQTLIGSVRAVVNTLGIASPMTLGRALRIDQRVRRLSASEDWPQRWQLELAATCSQLAAAGLTDDALRKVYGGEGLAQPEASTLLDSIASIAATLAAVPRLEPVADILVGLIALIRARDSKSGTWSGAEPGPRLLLAIVDLESLEAKGMPFDAALGILSEHPSLYGDDVLQRLNDLREADVSQASVVHRTDDLADGMVLAEDLRTGDGLLLLPRGFSLTQSTRNHIVGRFRQSLPDRVRVLISEDHTSSAERKAHVLT